MHFTNTSDNIKNGCIWLEKELLDELEPSALNKKILDEEKQEDYFPWSKEIIEVLKIKSK
jgi:hypothetical protein